MMGNDISEYTWFADHLLEKAKSNADANITLFELFICPYIIPLVLYEKRRVQDALNLLWKSEVDTVKKILAMPDPDVSDLDVLTGLLHDHVPYTVEINSVLEAISYALGNDNLFGEPFTDSRLQDAVDIPF